MDSSSSKVLENVQDYYGKVLQSSNDLKTQACINPGKTVNQYVACAISEVHSDVAARYYGCGLAIPPSVTGARILDLGSGSGRDCFALSKLVGASGEVVGVDMTSEQINVANEYIKYHTEKFNYSQSNVRFVQGYIENLVKAGLQSNYFDIIISNCVVNLSPDKKSVLSEAFNVLKPGGELYFSDMYTDTDLSDEVKKDKVLWAEGFSGALHWKNLHSLAKDVGFSKPYLMSCSPINIDREDFKSVLGKARFCSATYRLFKLPSDHKTLSKGQVIYKGEIPGHEDLFQFDHTIKLMSGSPICVSSEIMTVLQACRLRDEFKFGPAVKDVCCVDVPEEEDPFQIFKGKQKINMEKLKQCPKSGCC